MPTASYEALPPNIEASGRWSVGFPVPDDAEAPVTETTSEMSDGQCISGGLT